uniref:Cytochrome P450 n=1 Tax=Leptobrachium leishanense TaxID=445787 RepID=A0A8C5QU55_9ANUR
MMEINTLLLVLLVGLLFYHLIKIRIVASRMPPGPPPLPIFGNLWTLKFQLHHKTTMKLAKTYGNTITVWVGQTPIVVVHGYEAIREGLTANSEAIDMRAERPFFNVYANGQGVLVANGYNWKQQRRLGTQILRNLGLGKESLQWKIHAEARRMVDVFIAKKGTAHDPKNCLMNAVSNVVSVLSFGHIFSLDDDIFQDLVVATDSVTHFFGTPLGQLYDAFPWLVHNMPGPQQKVIHNLKILNHILRQEIESHKQNPSSEPTDVIDFYLENISKNEDDPASVFTEINLCQVLLDLFLAGSETLTSTLRWALLLMVSYPDIQEKVQSELDAYFQTSPNLHYENRKKVPYTLAVLHEIQRYVTVAPMGLPRQCAQDVKLNGYKIKKGTVVVFCLASAHYDPNYWKFPNDFCPSNFLDKDGNFQSNDAFIPFSAGHRRCIGENMARMEFFIFFTSLLHAFTFRLPQGITKVNIDGIFGTTFRPHPFHICAIPR